MMTIDNFGALAFFDDSASDEALAGAARPEPVTSGIGERGRSLSSHLLANLIEVAQARHLSLSDTAYLFELAVAPSRDMLSEIVEGLRSQTCGRELNSRNFQIIFFVVAMQRGVKDRFSLINSLDLHFPIISKYLNADGTYKDKICRNIQGSISIVNQSISNNVLYEERSIDSIKQIRQSNAISIENFDHNKILKTNASVDFIINCTDMRYQNLVASAFRDFFTPKFDKDENKELNFEISILNLLNLLRDYVFSGENSAAKSVNKNSPRSIRFTRIDNINDMVVRFCYDEYADTNDNLRFLDVQESLLLSVLIESGVVDRIFYSEEFSEFVIDYTTQLDSFYRLRVAANEQLRPLFDELSYPTDKQAAFVDRLISSFMEQVNEPHASWTKQISSGREEPLTDAPFALPDRAPAIWKTDKLPGDIPPDFIKRHYVAWLRSDATGLTRPDIKRLDPTLYTALTNWLQKGNSLPSDCPLPTKSEAITATLDRVADSSGDMPTRVWWAKVARERVAAAKKEK